jgi:hypothetical protein
MAQGATPIFSKSIVASASLTQYRGATLAGALPAAGGNGGIADTSATSGQMVTVHILGSQLAESGAAFNANVLLEFDAQGRMITRTTGAIVARSITAATAAGQLLEVVLIPN